MERSESQLVAEARLIEDATLAAATTLVKRLEVSGRSGIGSRQNLADLEVAIDEVELLVNKVQALYATARDLSVVIEARTT